MNLAIDIGNTSLKKASFSNSRVSNIKHINYSKNNFNKLLFSLKKDLDKYDSIYICSVVPELDIIIIASLLVIIPKSPWLISVGEQYWERVPVELIVLEILLAIWPDLPTPVIITLPLIFDSLLIALAKSELIDLNSFLAPDISVSITDFP